MEVKLDAALLPHDHRVFKFFPGRDYKFYTLMKEVGVAFVDVRDLDTLGRPGTWHSEDLLTHIAQDRVRRAIENGHEAPTRLVRSPGDKATQTFLEGLLFTAKQGDLIVMPDRGYTTDVMIGQLLDPPGTLVQVGAHDGRADHMYYGRRIKWIKGVEKRMLSESVIKLLHSQATFFDLGKSNYEEIYRIAFDNFVYDQQYFATFRTQKAIFTPKDSFLTSVWLELFEVLEEARENDQKLTEGSIYELVIDSDINEADRDDLSISVQSPGWFRIRSIVAAPLASLALFAMAAQGVPYDTAMAATTTAAVVGHADDTCLGDVDASVRDYIVLLGKERWEQACKLAMQAEKEAKLKAGAQVRPSSAKREED